MDTSSSTVLRSWRVDCVLLSALLLTIGLAFAFRLQALVVPEMDEGIYVYAGKLIAEGNRLYRDFMFAHPPVLPYIAAILWKIGGSLEATRCLTIAITLMSSIPLFLLARTLSRSLAAGLLAVVLYNTGLIWVANLGRTLRLEPILNLFLIAGVALWMLRRGKSSAFAAGVCFALAMETKFLAVVPIAFLALADLAWPVSGKADWNRRAWLALGAATLLVPVTAWCLSQPGFIDWVWTAQLARERIPLEDRLYALGQGLLRFPPLLLGLAFAAFVIWRGEPRSRALALAAIATTIASAMFFKTFFRHYLALVLPWVAVLLAVGLAELLTRPRQRAVLIVFCFALGAIAPVAFTLISLRVSPHHSTGAATVLPFLKQRDGYLLSPYPDFALHAGRELVPWYYIVDNYLPLSIGRVSDKDFATVIERTTNVVVLKGELDALPETRGVLAAKFRPLPVDSHWSAWERLP